MTNTKKYILFKTISLKELLTYRHKQFKEISLFISFENFKGIEVKQKNDFIVQKSPFNKERG